MVTPIYVNRLELIINKDKWIFLAVNQTAIQTAIWVAIQAAIWAVIEVVVITVN